jgi:hypothetical protein
MWPSYLPWRKVVKFLAHCCADAKAALTLAIKNYQEKESQTRG